jgi:CheY-like chemotaxis protein
VTPRDLKVLLLEDDELVRSTLAEGLEHAGLQVAEFSDPREALHRLETIAPPDVVVTDVDLGSTMNGFDVAIAAHNRWPLVGVILISGLPADHTGQRLDQRDRYLQKPLTYTLATDNRGTGEGGIGDFSRGSVRNGHGVLLRWEQPARIGPDFESIDAL